MPRSFFARVFGCCCGGVRVVRVVVRVVVVRGGVRVVFVEDFGVFFVFVVAAGTDAALGSFEALNNQPPVVGATNKDRRNNVTATSLIVWIVGLICVLSTLHNTTCVVC